MIYLLDTNAISDLIEGNQQVTNNFSQHIRQGDTLAICQPIYYEVQRGFLWRRNARKITILRDVIIPRLDWIELLDEDWIKAAEFWASTQRKGRQLADVDLLIAALAQRLDAIIVSSDADFDALPVKHEDWRV